MENTESFVRAKLEEGYCFELRDEDVEHPTSGDDMNIGNIDNEHKCNFTINEYTGEITNTELTQFKYRMGRVFDNVKVCSSISKDIPFNSPGKKTFENSNLDVDENENEHLGNEDPLYDETLDDADAAWVNMKRGCASSLKKKDCSTDAMLSCPACFITLCISCQRHEKYSTQYRAITAMNCEIKEDEILEYSSNSQELRESENPCNREAYHPVVCSQCMIQVGIIDSENCYHFFNVIPSNA